MEKVCIDLDNEIIADSTAMIVQKHLDVYGNAIAMNHL